MKQVKWISADTASGNSAVTHAYIPSLCKHKYLGNYEENKAICSKRAISEDGEMALKFESLKEDRRGIKCKKCLKILG
jgi:hypothetical protein